MGTSKLTQVNFSVETSFMGMSSCLSTAQTGECRKKQIGSENESMQYCNFCLSDAYIERFFPLDEY